MYNDEINMDMNKKKYTAPLMETIKMESQGLLASSSQHIGKGAVGQTNNDPEADDDYIVWGE